MKTNGSLLDPFLFGSLLSHLSTVGAEYTVSGFIRYRPRGLLVSLCIMCVQYRGGAQYRGVFSTAGDIMINVGIS